MHEAARVGDQIAHTHWMASLVTGIVGGVLVGAAIVATGGAAAVLLVSGLALGATSGVLGKLRTNDGPIVDGAARVRIGGEPAARAIANKVGCDPGSPIAQGSRRVLIEDFHAARLGDQTTCGGTISEGYPTVLIGMEPGTYAHIRSEVPAELRIAIGMFMVYGGARDLAGGGAKGGLDEEGFRPGTEPEPTTAEQGTNRSPTGEPEPIAPENAGNRPAVDDANRPPGTFDEQSAGTQKGELGPDGRPREQTEGPSQEPHGGSDGVNEDVNRSSDQSTEGHPVDVATGNVVDQAVDLSIPGLIPIAWSRRYCSAEAAFETSLGVGGWTHSFDQWIVQEDSRWTLRAEDGRDIYFPSGGAEQPIFHRRERLLLKSGEDGSLSVYSVGTRLTRIFAPIVPGGRAMLRSISDAHGNQVTLYYEGASLASITDTAGRVLHVHSDAFGRVTRIELFARDAVQTWVEYDYRLSGELATVTNALGHADRFEYDAQHRMTKTTLRNGVSFHYAYDASSGRCVRTWGDGGLHTVELQYDIERGRTEVRGTEEPKIYYWNAVGTVVRQETLDGRTLRVRNLDRDGFVLAEGPAPASLTRHEYDARGNRVKTVDPAGNTTSWEYDVDQLLRRTGPNGLVTRFEHDHRGNLAGVTYPSGERYALSYDAHGRLSTVDDGDRRIAAFAYDREHNVVREVDTRGAATDFEYDPVGRPVARTDALGHVTRVEYDRLGRAIAIQAPDGTVRIAAYEPLGNLTRTIDALGQVTEMEYAGTGVLKQVTLPDGQAWSMHYDHDERLSEVRNPHQERYTFTYDETGRVKSERSFDGRTLRYDYSELGQLASITYPDHTFRVFRRDLLGNVVEDRSAQSVVTFDRDPQGRLMKAVVQERSGLVVTELERDRLGRIVGETQNGHKIRYLHDDRGRRVARVLPDGATTRYGYDHSNSLTSVEHDGRRFSLDRDVLGREVERRTPDGGLQIRSAYDDMGRIVERVASTAHAALSRRTWKYDALGRVREIGDDRWGATSYQYDSISQLIEAKRGAYHEVFQYDVTGSLRNILSSLTDSQQPKAWDTEAGNLLTRTDVARYTYDARGRRVKKVALAAGEGVRVGDVTEYVWDERDRLREVQKPTGERVLFTYDAFGRRVRKEVVSPEGEGTHRVVEFLWDGDELAADIDSRRGTRVFVHEPGTFIPMLQAEQGEVFAVVNDQLGMPKDLVDQDGRVAWSAAHSAWGKVVEEYQDASARRKMPVESPFRLLGQYADEETGLCYTRFRYFDAEVGRWCSPDPLGIRGDRSAHQFGGAPTKNIDPLGLCASDGVKSGDFVDLTEHRADHILNRHRFGAGKPGKTEFPSTWSDDRILHEVSDVATDPSAVQGVGKWDSPYAVGTRDGVKIRVDFYPPGHPAHAGKISTAYPIEPTPGPLE